VVFDWRYAVYGHKPSSDAASVTGFNGHATDALPTSTYQDLELHILILRIASRHVPEAGAVCGSSARTDLCGKWQVTAFPTATGARWQWSALTDPAYKAFGYKPLIVG